MEVTLFGTADRAIDRDRVIDVAVSGPSAPNKLLKCASLLHEVPGHGLGRIFRHFQGFNSTLAASRDLATNGIVHLGGTLVTIRLSTWAQAEHAGSHF